MTYQTTIYCKAEQAPYFISRLKAEFKGEINFIKYVAVTGRRGHHLTGYLSIGSDWMKSEYRFNNYFHMLSRDLTRLLGE